MNHSGIDGRPPVSVVVPFAGGLEDARETVAAMQRIAVGAGDQLILADNSVSGAGSDAARGTPVEAVRATHERSSYHARNAGAEAARNAWLLFMDADCLPQPGILDAHFDPQPAEDCGVVAGQVEPDPNQTAVVARYARERTHIRVEPLLESSYKPAGLTPNMLIRRAAFDAVGGFQEGLASGADVEICWRIQDARWTLEYRPGAIVEHRHVETLRALYRQNRRHAAGRAWLNRRYPGATPRPKLMRRFFHALGGAAYRTLRLQFERALFRLIDAGWFVVDSGGYMLGNRARPFPEGPEQTPRPAGELVPVLFLCDAFPALSETFIASEARALRSLGHALRVESGERPERPDRIVGRELPLTQLEDDGIAIKFLLAAWLCLRHPLRVLADARQRRRWGEEEGIWPLRSLAPMAWRLQRSGERHIHVHFAETAALNGLRLSRLLKLPWSVTAHGYDIFKDPRNLPEKLTEAAFATTGCEYNARHLRGVAPEAAGHIHVIVMGVDGERFRREGEPPAERHVVAVGRLVEKKGFADLIEAARLLHGRGAIDRLTIAGDGPLREDLEAQISAGSLEGVVALEGWRETGGVRELLEGAAVLAAPSVVAADGDRDSMPVVIKEALAMEVPVVGADEVGIPEVVEPRWGRLVPPRDPEALAAALEDLLSMSRAERSAMGRAGREAVLARFAVGRESERLSELIEEAAR